MVFTKAFGKTLRILFKRPFIFVFFSIIALVYSVIDNSNPVTSILFRWSSLNNGDIFGSIVIIFRGILKVLLTTKGIAVAAAFVLVGAFLIAIIFPGYFNMVGNALDGKPRSRGEFAVGIKKYFTRIFLMSIVFLISTILFAIFLMVAAVPALVITTSAFAGKQGLLFTAVLVDFITVFVLFFGFMFFRIYISFWYPAAVTYKKKAFVIGKRTADAYFWGLVKRLLAFDAVFIIFQFVIVNIGNSTLMLAVKWVFYTLFFAFLITYIFAMFKSLQASDSKKSA